MEKFDKSIPTQGPLSCFILMFSAVSQCLHYLRRVCSVVEKFTDVVFIFKMSHAVRVSKHDLMVQLLDSKSRLNNDDDDQGFNKQSF